MINEILQLAEKLPSGLNDKHALSKLQNEYDELQKALDNEDYDGALTEAADAGYYVAKYLDWVARQVDLSVDDVLKLTLIKYGLRSQPGNPKNDIAERFACGKYADRVKFIMVKS